MDTITHGIAGALIGKAFFSGDELFNARPATKERTATFAATLGAVLPDADVIRDFFSRDELSVLTWHRGITHSLLALPFLTLGLAALTHWLARRRGWNASSLATLSVIYAVAIASHIVLDLITSFGTMVWTPFARTRPAWDLVFILDFTFTALVLLPQMAAWVYGRREGWRRRATRTWLVFFCCALAAGGILQLLEFPVSLTTIAAIVLLLAALFFAPTWRGRGFRIERRTWCRAGVVALAGYLGLASLNHSAAVRRVEEFAAEQHLTVDALGALPLPPSVWHWDGLVRAPRGVYEFPIDLPGVRGGSRSGETGPPGYRYYPDSPSNPSVEAARRLSAVKTVLWFARFPVVRSWKQGSDAIVEFLDLRFFRRAGRPAPFTYRVRLDGAGRVIEQGWVAQ